MSWLELRAFIGNLLPTSAVHRSLRPNSWWWTPTTDFLAALLCSVQMGNWQRGGGKGGKPKPVKRPKDPPKRRGRADPKTGAELAARRQRTREELARRRRVSSG